MSVEINNIKNANVYIDGVNFLGKADEVKTPDITAKFIERKGLGMIGSVELFSGIEKMETTIKWNSLYPEAMLALGNFTKSVNCQVRTSIETWSSKGLESETPAVYYFNGTPKNIPGIGTVKSQENSESESKLATNYAKLVIGSDTIYEIDIMNSIYKVADKDILAKYKKNLGI